MMTSSLCFLNLFIKLASENLQHLKLYRLIVYSKFHKMCKFENHVTRNDNEKMENNGKTIEKQWKNEDLRGNQTKYISFERF